MNGIRISSEKKSGIRAELVQPGLMVNHKKVMTESHGTAKRIASIARSDTEIVGEMVRRKSLKIIMQASKRGFIVDKKISDSREIRTRSFDCILGKGEIANSEYSWRAVC
jgi:hypothetical protein